MPVLRELLARELLMLVILAGIGAGPASLLSSRFGAIERVALAPILGLCLGTSLFTTLIYFFPASDTDWLVPVLAVASTILASVRTHRAAGWRQPRAALAGWVSLALVIVVVTAPILSVMRSQHTIGPVSYAVGDAAGYIAETDSEVQQSLHAMVRTPPPYSNLEQAATIRYVRGYQNLDFSPLSANVDSLVGLGSTETWQAFLIAAVLAGGLGALGAVRWALRDGEMVARTLGGAVAGTTFAGAMFLQLYFAGSQAALCGLSILLPLGAIAADAAIEPSPIALALLAIPISGLIAMYPLFVAPTAAAGGAALLFMTLRRWRSGRDGALAAMREGAVRVGFVLVLAVCLNLVSFLRDLRYWKAVLKGSLNSSSFGFPEFNMKVEGLPSWLFQTRDLFRLTTWMNATPVQLVEELIVPVAFIAIIVIALRRFPVLCWLVVVIAVAALLGEYEAAKNACSYCTDRSLLPIAPLLAGLLAVGMGVLWMSHRPILRGATLVALVAWLMPAFAAGRDIHNRVAGGATFLDSSARAALGHLPHGASVDVEAFDSNPNTASPNDPFAYELAQWRADGRATMPGDVSNYNAIAYLGVFPLSAGQFNPNYRYVLTRLPGVATARQTVFRSGGVALQRRVQRLDVTVDGALEAPPERYDPSGVAWVSSALPLRLIVAGQSAGPAYVGVQMIESVRASVERQPGLVSRLRGHNLTVCVKAQGTAPFRVAQFQVSYSPVPAFAGPGQAPIGVGVQLAAVAVAANRCPFAAELR